MEDVTLLFFVSERNGHAVPFANIAIVGRETDTSLNSDMDGLATSTLPSGHFSVSILALAYTSVKLDGLDANGNTKTTIYFSLGKSNASRTALIYSVRKLTNSEIEQIVGDLSDDWEDNHLIKNKTCRIMWEI